MSEENVEGSSVEVRISSKAVYKAVKNILNNECKINPDEIKAEVRKGAEDIIQREVLGYLASNSYDKAQLGNRVRQALETWLHDLRPIVKEIVKELVHKQIEEEIEGVVGAIITNGLEVRLGYGRKKVKVKMADNEQEKPKS